MGRTSTARDDLVAAAFDLMWERGFVDVGVSELCETAGVRPGSFYHFFRSKSDLGVAAIQSHLESTRDLVLKPASAIEDAVERLRFYFDYLADSHEAMAGESGQVKGCPFGNLAGEAPALDPELRSALADASREMADFFVQLTHDAVSQGHSATQEPDARGKALFAFVEGLLIMSRMRNDASTIRDLAPQATAFLTA